MRKLQDNLTLFLLNMEWGMQLGLDILKLLIEKKILPQFLQTAVTQDYQDFRRVWTASHSSP